MFVLIMAILLVVERQNCYDLMERWPSGRSLGGLHLPQRVRGGMGRTATHSSALLSVALKSLGHHVRLAAEGVSFGAAQKAFSEREQSGGWSCRVAAPGCLG